MISCMIRCDTIDGWRPIILNYLDCILVEPRFNVTFIINITDDRSEGGSGGGGKGSDSQAYTNTDCLCQIEYFDDNEFEKKRLTITFNCAN